MASALKSRKANTFKTLHNSAGRQPATHTLTNFAAEAMKTFLDTEGLAHLEQNVRRPSQEGG
jgi:hypothetical protein